MNPYQPTPADYGRTDSGYAIQSFSVCRVKRGRDTFDPDLRDYDYFYSLIDAVDDYNRRVKEHPERDFEITHWPVAGVRRNGRILHKSWWVAGTEEAK